jgi:hypothetical protein
MFQVILADKYMFCRKRQSNDEGTSTLQKKPAKKKTPKKKNTLKKKKTPKKKTPKKKKQAQAAAAPPLTTVRSMRDWLGM